MPNFVDLTLMSTVYYTKKEKTVVKTTERRKMKDYLQILKKSTLFSSLQDQEIEQFLKAFPVMQKNYQKHETVLWAGNQVTSLGIVLEGCVHVVKEDFWGHRNIVAQVCPAQVFAETYACVENSVLQVDVVAAETSKILFLELGGLLAFQAQDKRNDQIVHNLLSILAEKNLQMNAKLTHISQRTTREKLLSYLSEEALRHGSPEFVIPFNRQQLADYLSVDRSAMSNELCKMRDEGILSFHKSCFQLFV